MILTVPFVVFGFDILKSGILKLLHLSPNMNSLVSIGVCASLIYSFIHLVFIFLGNSMYVESLYFESAAMILYFIKLGRYIDHKSKEKTKEAIQELVQITPSMARIKTKNGSSEITIDEVKKGDILLCLPGDKVAVDGVIVSGETHMNEAFITGESKVNKKEVSDKVIAGSINIDGVIEYKAERIGPDSTISEIVRLVVEATNTKAPIQRLADVISSYFVPSIIILSILTLMFYLILGHSFQEAITSFVTVLLVACPCSLGLATPLAVVVSEGRAAKNGILIKTSEILEKAHKVDTIVFDKTGTLTYGSLKISKFYNFTNMSDNHLLQIIASLESNSTHPIASSFKHYLDDNFFSCLEVSHFKNIEGMGIQGVISHKEYYVGSSKLLNKYHIKNTYLSLEEELSNDGNSILYVIEGKKILALIGVKDVVRENAYSAIQS